jgi:polyferredoxin
MKRQRIRRGVLIVSFLLLPLTLYYFSPDLIIEGAFEGAVAGSMVLFALLFLFSLFFGRAFCGWACPLGGLQECLMGASGKRARGGSRDWIKYFIWVPWLAFIGVGAVVAGGITKLDIFYRTDHGVSVSDIHSLIIYFAVVAIVTAFALIGGRRSFCHTLCWIAPFMVLGTKLRNALRIPSLHLKAEPEKCTGCVQCTKHCPMSLDVNEMVKRGDMRNAECILCGECVDGCARKAIQYKFLWTVEMHVKQDEKTSV